MIKSLLSLPRWIRQAAWIGLDIGVLVGGYVIAQALVGGADLTEPMVGIAVAGAGLLYVGAVAGAGGYAQKVHTLHLRAFMRMAAALTGAVLVTMALLYLGDIGEYIPREVVLVHWLMVMVGMLGSRAIARLIVEEQGVPVSPDSSPDPLVLKEVTDRPPPVIDTNALRDVLADRTVLVTGAAGSIGKELSLQLQSLQPFRLVLVDMSEYNLYQLEHALREQSYEGEIERCLLDIRNNDAMARLFQRVTPDVVIHTAAYKHVPLMEHHPAEAFHNNTLATLQLLDLCETNDVEDFIFVSTDKAVEPTSVLGATKQLSEWYVRASTSSVRRTVVRFGNVFGSRGSVVPFFEERLAAGKPVPITHPNMERYFMSVSEACSLILHTLLLNTHPVYLFRMGEPVRIMDLAEQLVQRWYPHLPPETMIDVVGRRPGEKLSEALAGPEETIEETAHPSIMGVQGGIPHSRTELDVHIQHIERQCRMPDVPVSHVRRLIVDPPSQTLSRISADE